jgi:hypothetical protein
MARGNNVKSLALSQDTTLCIKSTNVHFILVAFHKVLPWKTIFLSLGDVVSKFIFRRIETKGLNVSLNITFNDISQRPVVMTILLIIDHLDSGMTEMFSRPRPKNK